MDLHDFRTNYSLGTLSQNDLDPSPIRQFGQWLEQMVEVGLKDPNAMIVATVDEHAQASQRYVLLKKVDEQGFVFFTDTSSTKGQQIADNAQVSLLFPWHQYERQVHIQGVAQPLEREAVQQYFASRPLASQLAAAISQQSQPIASREALMERYTELQAQTTDSVALPQRWGGYCVKPKLIEFWQGGEHRLHDRFVYTPTQNGWQIQRLQP